MTRAWAAAALLIAACGKGDRAEPPAAGSGSGGTPAPDAAEARVKALAIPGSAGGTELVRGARRVAFVNGGRWLAPTPAGPVEVVADAGAELATACGDYDHTLFLARDPVAACGEEHQERTTRLVRGGPAVELPGIPLRAVALRDGTEVWVVEERLQTQLVVLAPDGGRRVYPPFARTGALPASPVRAKACAAARIVDLAGDGAEAVALVVECDPDAPVQLARITGATAPPASEVAPSLGFVPQRVAVAKGVVAVAGVRGDELAFARLGGEKPRSGPRPTGQVTGLEIADDGAVWALTVGTRDRQDVWTLSRDGVAVPTGALVPRALGADAALGIVGVAGDGTAFTVR
ncbi:MAG: hypothetical protein KF773_11685 [Deltaproteobacteria bacterium]|nr:hypothetical protein [Deltaproteobacteria bacterium]